MATFEKLAGKLLHLEGGYVNHPLDKGGPTKYGVILAVWKEFGYDKDGDGDIDAEDIKKLTEEDAHYIAKRIFWDFFKADQINNQSIAEVIVDWGYNSGRKTIAKKVQKLIGVTADGIFGPKTLMAVNSITAKDFFDVLLAQRKIFYDNIVKREPDQMVFYKGWMNRLKAFQFAE